MRVRGLKPPIFRIVRPKGTSHPVRVRGLKRVYVSEVGADYFVAPRAGAWIETLSS